MSLNAVKPRCCRSTVKHHPGTIHLISSIRLSTYRLSMIVIFTTLHCMQRGLSYEHLSVYPTVCPSVCQTREL